MSDTYFSLFDLDVRLLVPDSDTARKTDTVRSCYNAVVGGPRYNEPSLNFNYQTLKYRLVTSTALKMSNLLHI